MLWRTHVRNVIATVLVVTGLLSSVAAAAYELDDLAGTWSIHGLVGGAAPNVPGSFYMTGTANASGAITGTDYADSSGVSAASWADDTGVLDLSGGGILTLSGEEALFRGVMSWEEDFAVAVGTIAPGPDTGLEGENLWTLVRQSPTPVFAQSDGAGTWWLHGLYVDDDSSGAWTRGQIEVDAAGSFAFAPGTFQTSDGDANTPPPGTVSVTSYGYVGFSFDPDIHGIMNLDKDLIVFSMPETEGGSLNFLLKRSPSATFSLADLSGFWHFYELYLELDQGRAVWNVGMMEVDDAGAMQLAMTSSNGQTDTATGTVSVTANGVITYSGNPTARGTMNDDKNLIVLTSDNGAEGCNLVVMVKAVVTPLYRFWSAGAGRHFYTVSLAEKTYIEATWPDAWTYENEAYYAFPEDGETGLMPVYRFWSPPNQSHFYTISEDEKNYIEATWPDAWTYEGVAFYAYTSDSPPASSKPVYRFWSPTLLTHFYTISESEKNYIEATWPDAWTYEDIAWYAFE